jgi:pyruvate dehydrogenase (quinone)
MLVGQGALYATEEVTEVADILGAGVAKALLGKAVVSDYEPWVTGAIGLLGTGPSWALMQGADTLLMVGTNGSVPGGLSSSTGGRARCAGTSSG